MPLRSITNMTTSVDSTPICAPKLPPPKSDSRGPGPSARVTADRVAFSIIRAEYKTRFLQTRHNDHAHGLFQQIARDALDRERSAFHEKHWLPNAADDREFLLEPTGQSPGPPRLRQRMLMF